MYDNNDEYHYKQTRRDRSKARKTRPDKRLRSQDGFRNIRSSNLDIDETRAEESYEEYLEDEYTEK